MKCYIVSYFDEDSQEFYRAVITGVENEKEAIKRLGERFGSENHFILEEIDVNKSDIFTI